MKLIRSWKKKKAETSRKIQEQLQKERSEADLPIPLTPSVMLDLIKKNR